METADCRLLVVCMDEQRPATAEQDLVMSSAVCYEETGQLTPWP